MYVIFLQCTHCVEKTLIFSCTLLCESGDRVKCDQSSFSAYLHAVMLRHHCSEYGIIPWINDKLIRTKFELHVACVIKCQMDFPRGTAFT